MTDKLQTDRLRRRQYIVERRYAAKTSNDTCYSRAKDAAKDSFNIQLGSFKPAVHVQQEASSPIAAVIGLIWF